MTWTLHPISEFANHAVQWDALVAAQPGTPFLSSAFLLPALEVFGNGDEILCLSSGGSSLTAGAIVQRGRLGAWQTFQPSQLPLGAWVAAGDSMDAVRGLIPKLPGLALALGLTQLDSRLCQRPNNNDSVRTQDYIQTAWVDVEGPFDGYWEKRGKNLKQNTRKQRNKLETEATATQLECCVDAADVAMALQEYGQLESAGWKTADGTAIHPDNAQGRFYRQMLENFCALDRGRIYKYRFGGKVVAMDLCICDASTIVILKTTYDESCKAVSPSTLMRQDQFRQLFEEHRFTRIEFYGKVMEWHTRWTEHSRPLFHLNAYRHPLVGWAHQKLSNTPG